MNTNPVRCGLDFGTSNSVISLVDVNSGKEIFTYSDRSILYFPEGKELTYSVGKEAQDKYVEDGMKGRLLKSVKTLLKQDKFLFTWISGKRVTPDQLAMYIILHMKQKAEAFLGRELSEVVLGRPAIFSEDKKQETIAVKRLMLAAKNAGFSQVTLQLEPIAAALYYQSQLEKPERVLVADFGGGTTDFTIMDLKPSNKTKSEEHEIIANSGIYIGGDTFDSEMMWHVVTPHLGRGVTYRSYDKDLEIPLAIFRELKRWEKSFLLKGSKLRSSLDNYYFHSDNHPLINNLRLLIDNNYTYSLFKSIEKTKMTLSEEQEADFVFSKEALEITDIVQLEKFSTMLEKHILDIEQNLIQMLNRCNLSFGDIDTVFITGGSSFVKPVRELFYKHFDANKVLLGDAFSSVAYGLAL